MQALTDLENQINSDSGLDVEVKTKLLDLIKEVKVDPKDANLEALAVVLDTVADSEEYKQAVALIGSWTAATAV